MRLPWLKIGHAANEPPAERRNRGTVTFKRGGAGVADVLRLQRKNATDTYERADLVAVSSPLPVYTPTNVSADRSFDANATTTAELADVLGTLIADLQETGVIG